MKGVARPGQRRAGIALPTSAVVTRPHGAAAAAALPGSCRLPGSPPADGHGRPRPARSGAQGRARPWRASATGTLRTRRPAGGRRSRLCQPSRYPSWRSAGTEGRGRALGRGPQSPAGLGPAERARGPQRGALHQARAAPARGRGRAPARSQPASARRRRRRRRRPAWGVARPARGRGGGRAHRGRGPRRGAGTWPPGLRSSGGWPAGWVATPCSRARPARPVPPLVRAPEGGAARPQVEWAWCGGARCGGGAGRAGRPAPPGSAGGGGRAGRGTRPGAPWAARCPRPVGLCVAGQGRARRVHLPPQGVSVRMGRAFGWRTSHPSTRTQRWVRRGRYGGHPGVRSGRTCRPCPGGAPADGGLVDPRGAAPKVRCRPASVGGGWSRCGALRAKPPRRGEAGAPYRLRWTSCCGDWGG